MPCASPPSTATSSCSRPSTRPRPAPPRTTSSSRSTPTRASAGIGETDVNPWIARACIEAPGTHNMGLGLTRDADRRGPARRRGAVGAALRRLRDERPPRRRHQRDRRARRRAARPARQGARQAVPRAARRRRARPRRAVRVAAARGRRTSTTTATRWSSGRRRRSPRASRRSRRRSRSKAPTRTPACASRGSAAPRCWPAVRAAIGSEVALLVDVQYAFPDADTALAVLRDWEEFDLYFVETPLWPDDLDGYARPRRPADPDRRRRVADDALRAPRPDGPRQDPRLAARHRPRRRPHRGQARRRAGGRARPAGRPAPVEDGHLDRRRGAPRCRHAALRLHRVPAARSCARRACARTSRATSWRWSTA